MGRKSKKKGGKGARRSNVARSQPSAPDKDKGAPPPGAPPPGASCWICLDEEPDDAGRPIVRDCSCRGASAGFAHLSCLVQYAEQKCGYADQYTDDARWMKPFLECPNCNQHYRSQLAIDLASACVDFVEEKQPDCTFRRMGALQIKLGMVVMHGGGYSLDLVEECEGLAKECLSVVEQLKSDPRMFSNLPSIGAVQMDVLMMLGNLHADGGVASSGRKAIEYYEKAKAISNSGYCVNVSSRVATASLDAMIAEAKVLYEGEKEDRGKKLKDHQLIYQKAADHFGETSQEAVHTGLSVVAALKDMHRVVEAERFLDKLAADSRRVLGSEHTLSKATAEGLQALRVRVISVNHGSGLKAFQALRYAGSGKKLVVRGPIRTPRDAGKGTTIEVDTPVMPALGTPVICHGLKSTPELNGKLGDMRGQGGGPALGRLLVHLEGRKKPILVKPENLRIAFDLPVPTQDGSV